MRQTRTGGMVAMLAALSLLLTGMIALARPVAAATPVGEAGPTVIGQLDIDNNATVFIMRDGIVHGVALDTGHEWPINPLDLRAVRADVSPDGTTLAFHTRGPLGPGNLYLINTDGSNLRVVDVAPHSMHEVFWDSTGERIYFDYNIGDLQGAPFRIASFDLETKIVTDHTPAEADVRLIGARPGVLAYWELDGPDGSTTFVHVDPESGNEVLRRMARGPTQAKLNADGSQAIYATREEGVVVLSLGGNHMSVSVLQPNGEVSWPRLSPDGRWAAFTDRNELIAVELADPSNRLVLAGPPTITSVINQVWLPDSSGLVFATNSFGEMQSVHASLDGEVTETGSIGLAFRAVYGIAGGVFIEPSPPPEPEPIASCEIDGAPDADCDGAIDWDDAFPDDPSESSDLDFDGIGDKADNDLDGDDHANAVDVFPLDSSEWEDENENGIGDNEDRWRLRRAREFIREAEDAGLVDADGDGTWDPTVDADGDGYHDAIDWYPEAPPTTSCWTPSTEPLLFGPAHSDYDGDGQPDSIDQDLDNDGVTTEQEIEELRWHHGDGDLDGDGILDEDDTDLDGDGYANEADQFPFDSGEWLDFDCGGLGDNSDPDDDDDGVFDDVDPFPLNNHEWEDSDGDGIGNQLDADDDNDGTLDSIDVFPTDPTATTDTDFDGIPNSIDPDDDNDDVLDVDDAFPLDRLYSRDTDGDGEGDYSELAANNPELTALIEETLGLRDANGNVILRQPSTPIRSSPSSEDSGTPWRLLRIFVLWPLIFIARKSRQSNE